MNLVTVKNNDIKVIERHPVKVLGNDYRVKIVYKNVKIEFAENQNNAGMLGALYNFKSR